MRKNLRGAEQFSRLAEHILDRAGQLPIDFYPSPGNWGDSLINAGTRELFREFGIEATERNRAEIKILDRSKIVSRLAIVGGGGGWNRNWGSTIGFVAEISSIYANVIVLPSSFDLDLIAQMDRRNIFLYTRADDSLSEIDGFCHDMALYCELPEPLESEIQYPLIAFRRDKERSSQAISPDRNWDISLLGTAQSSHLRFFELIDRFSVVMTDRLHIALAGAMLGKQVDLLDGNYGKNSGVFHASIRDNFNNVRLLPWAEVRDKGFVGMLPIGVPGYDEGM